MNQSSNNNLPTNMELNKQVQAKLDELNKAKDLIEKSEELQSDPELLQNINKNIQSLSDYKIYLDKLKALEDSKSSEGIFEYIYDEVRVKVRTSFEKVMIRVLSHKQGGSYEAAWIDDKYRVAYLNKQGIADEIQEGDNELLQQIDRLFDTHKRKILEAYKSTDQYENNLLFLHKFKKKKEDELLFADREKYVKGGKQLQNIDDIRESKSRQYWIALDDIQAFKEANEGLTKHTSQELENLKKRQKEGMEILCAADDHVALHLAYLSRNYDNVYNKQTAPFAQLEEEVKKIFMSSIKGDINELEKKAKVLRKQTCHDNKFSNGSDNDVLNLSLIKGQLKECVAWVTQKDLDLRSLEIMENLYEFLYYAYEGEKKLQERKSVLLSTAEKDKTYKYKVSGTLSEADKNLETFKKLLQEQLDRQVKVILELPNDTNNDNNIPTNEQLHPQVNVMLERLNCIKNLLEKDKLNQCTQELFNQNIPSRKALNENNPAQGLKSDELFPSNKPLFEKDRSDYLMTEVNKNIKGLSDSKEYFANLELKDAVSNTEKRKQVSKQLQTAEGLVEEVKSSLTSVVALRKKEINNKLEPIKKEITKKANGRWKKLYKVDEREGRLEVTCNLKSLSLKVSDIHSRLSESLGSTCNLELSGDRKKLTVKLKGVNM